MLTRFYTCIVALGLFLASAFSQETLPTIDVPKAQAGATVLPSNPTPRSTDADKDLDFEVIIAALALIFSGIAIWISCRQKKMDTTLTLLNQWNDIAMREHRAAVWAHLASIKEAKVNYWAKSAGQNDGQNLDRSYSIIQGFLGTLTVMFEQELIKKKLVKEMLAFTVLELVNRLIERVDYTPGTNQKEEERMKWWIDKRVKPLLKLLKA